MSSSMMSDSKLNTLPDQIMALPKEKFETKIALSGIEPKLLNGLLSFETYFELLKLPIPTKLDNMIERFEEENLIKRRGTRFGITNLAAILFAKDLAQYEDLTRKSIRLIAYDGKDRITTKKEYEERRGYAVAFSPILRFLDTIKADLIKDSNPSNKSRKHARYIPFWAN